MKTSNGKQLAKKMLIAMICGLACGFGCIMLREHLISSGQTDLWTKINKLFFQDITQPTATKAVGIFYIVGQLFVNSLQLIIVPMVFVSITLAISTITDTKKLGRISTKTILTFFITTVCALCFAGVIASIVYRLGFFNAVGKAAVTIQQGSTGSNPLNIILNIIPNNLISAFSTNGNVLAIVFIAVAMGLAMNTLEEETKTLKKLFEEVSKIITLFLSFVVNKFAPIGIFCLLTRTFAIYGIDSLRPALAYVVTVVIALFIYLFLAYPIYLMSMAKGNPKPFMKKMVKVALFGFSTSSSAATLPINKRTVTEELGVNDQIASFVLPLGMTINMDGTAIMQGVAVCFAAQAFGITLTPTDYLTVIATATLASIGTAGVPSVGLITLSMVFASVGLPVEAIAMIMGIDRILDMARTMVNITGDAMCTVIVANQDGALNRDVFNSK